MTKRMTIGALMILVAAVALVLCAARAPEAAAVLAACIGTPALAVVGWWRWGGKIVGAVGWAVAGPIVLALAGLGFVFGVLNDKVTWALRVTMLVIPLTLAAVGGLISKRKVSGALIWAILGMSAQVAFWFATVIVKNWIHPTPPSRMLPREIDIVMVLVLFGSMWVPAGAVVGGVVAAVLRFIYGRPAPDPASKPRPVPAEPMTSPWSAVEPWPETTDA